MKDYETNYKPNQDVGDRPKTGLERFIDKYGEDWRVLAFSGDVSVPNEEEGEYLE